MPDSMEHSRVGTNGSSTSSASENKWKLSRLKTDGMAEKKIRIVGYSSRAHTTIIVSKRSWGSAPGLNLSTDLSTPV